MTAPDDVFRAIIKHWDELLTLIKTDDDRDIFQDTCLYLAEHAKNCTGIVRKFRLRFRYLRIESLRQRLSPLLCEVPNTSEEYEETYSDEHTQDIIDELRNAILAEEEEIKKRSRRHEKKGKAENLLDSKVEVDADSLP